MLARRYETLRHDAVTPGAGSQDVRGLALLVRRGMAAWMRGVAEAGVRAASASTLSGFASTMALGNVMEAFA
jgi:hypothetical protein